MLFFRRALTVSYVVGGLKFLIDGLPLGFSTLDVIWRLHIIFIPREDGDGGGSVLFVITVEICI